MRTSTPIGGGNYRINSNGASCTIRLRFDGSTIINARQPLPEGTIYPDIQGAFEALEATADE